MLLPLIAVITGLAATPLTPQEVAHDVRTVVDTLDVTGLKVSIRKLNGSANPSPLLVKATGQNCTLWVNQGTMAHAMWEQYLGENAAETQAALRDFAVAHEIGHCIASDLRARGLPLPTLSAADQVLSPDGPVNAATPLTIRVPISAATATTEMAVSTKAKTAAAQQSTRQQRSNSQSKTVTTAPTGRKVGLMATNDPVKSHLRRYEEVFSDLVALRFIRISHPGEYTRVRDHLIKLRHAHGFYDPEHDSSSFLTETNLTLVADVLDAKSR